MNAERHRLISHLFLQVCELPMPAREQVLRDACTADPTLFDDVTALLAAHDSEPEDTDSATIWRRTFVGDDDPLAVPERIGRYEILGELGGGGMGSVFRGRSRFPDREVALKIIRQGLLSEAAIDYFEHEVQVLGRLRHPGIAQIYEAGTFETPLGAQPFLAMELVEGPPLKEYVQRHALSRRQRLSLFARICDAVHHAHLHGVVHRDLKPSNILIEGDTQPKILDFGIALASRHGEVEDVFDDSHPVGTFEYMSPEQANGETTFDPRSDVYSLGVLLFELLCDAVPLDLAGLDRAAAFETVRRAELRSPASLGLRDGDLLAILDRALARSVSARYQSASEFAADVRRYLRNEPLQARSHTARYLAWKFARRNKILVTSSAAIFLTVFASAVIALALFIQAVQAKARADEASAQVMRLSHLRRISLLEEAADGLWPRRPIMIEECEEQIVEARRLLSFLPEHLVALEGWKNGTLPLREGDDPEWWIGQQEKLIGKLNKDLCSDAHLVNSDVGDLLEDLEERLSVAREVFQKTVSEEAEGWRYAMHYVATAPVYKGLALFPQVGLVPLGEDPTSGLLEFLCWETGARPRECETTAADPGARQWHMRPETGLVLVLLPSIEFWMGNGDWNGIRREFSRHPVSLDAFFVSKYEMTQGQWRTSNRFRENPSTYDGQRYGSLLIDDTHPVESLDHQQARVGLRRLGLELPTEAQWEYAASGGLPFSWPFLEGIGRGRSGGFVQTVDVCEDFNLADQSLSQLFQDQGDDSNVPKFHEGNDGFPLHAPVGRFRPNLFGLYDVIGNVEEWVKEPLYVYPLSPFLHSTRSTAHLPGNGELVSDFDNSPGSRVTRGGSYLLDASQARVMFRRPTKETARSPSIGVRPARRLDPHPVSRLLAWLGCEPSGNRQGTVATSGVAVSYR